MSGKPRLVTEKPEPDAAMVARVHEIVARALATCPASIGIWWETSVDICHESVPDSALRRRGFIQTHMEIYTDMVGGE